mgnify:CR=1 FL=1
MWTLMFLHFRVRNPFISSAQVNKLLLRNPNELSRMIRSYSIFVYEQLKISTGAEHAKYGIKINENNLYIPTMNGEELR